MTRKQSGFTLIELLVVVLIIGILAAIALPQYQFAVEKSRIAEPLTITSSLQKAIDVWLLSNGGYPSDRIDFLGDNANGKGSLDIDIENGMNCSVNSGKACQNQNFQYGAMCNLNTCYIYIDRIVKDNRVYTFEYSRQKATNRWIGGECDCYDSYPVGVKICKWLASQNVGHWVCHDC